METYPVPFLTMVNIQC